jgi:hypothetical protein
MEDLKFDLTDPELEKIEDPIIKQKAYLSKEVMDKRLDRYKLPEFNDPGKFDSLEAINAAIKECEERPKMNHSLKSNDILNEKKNTFRAPCRERRSSIGTLMMRLNTLTLKINQYVENFMPKENSKSSIFS